MGVPLAIWDHTMLLSTRHKATHPALTPAIRLILDVRTLEGWNAELYCRVLLTYDHIFLDFLVQYFTVTVKQLVTTEHQFSAFSAFYAVLPFGTQT